MEKVIWIVLRMKASECGALNAVRGLQPKGAKTCSLYDFLCSSDRTGLQIMGSSIKLKC